jgi:hypothetical protein
MVALFTSHKRAILLVLILSCAAFLIRLLRHSYAMPTAKAIHENRGREDQLSIPD